uniref:sn-1-specific diacylglycerol lipase ABHD11 n=1 Tax=Heliothis virescens TaxID=7102 RepID=A0A2A4K9I4_HELVI
MNSVLAINTFRQQQYIGFKKINRTRAVLNRGHAVDLVHRFYGPSPAPDSVPIIVLHGFLDCKSNWQNMCKRITAHTNRTLIAVDARNHGDSPHNDSHDYFDLAADVSKLITDLSVKKSIIIGHDMGGKTGMVLALTEPSKVESLIVVDISPVSTSSTLKNLYPKVLDVMTDVNFTATELNKAQMEAKNVIMENESFRSQEDIYFILMNIGRLPDKTYGWKCNLEALKNNFDFIASFPIDVLIGSNYPRPTLFIGGSRSTFIPVDDLNGIQRFFPQSVLHYIKGAGHNVHAENPNAFFNVVKDFLAFHERRKSSSLIVK